MKSLKPYFKMSKNITYLDSAALVLKPNSAIKANNNFYTKYSVSTRTSNAPLGIKNTQIINNLRQKIALLLNTNLEQSSIIFTSGTTQSLNIFAKMIQNNITCDDEILISPYNHSSNFIPWIEVAKKTKAKLVVKENLLDYINPKTKIIALSQVTNNFNITHNLEQIFQKAQSVGAYVINDAAQAIIYENVSMLKSHIIAFSANKFYGPTGLGVLAINNDLLKRLQPVDFGGGSVINIDVNNNWTQIPTIDLYEPGTINLAGIYMFNAAIDFFNNYIGYKNTNKILKTLANYAYKKLNTINNIEIYSSVDDHIILFNIKGYDSHDIAHYLGQHNIYVRSGLFCAHYLRNIKNVNSYVRVSLGVYNTKNDINKLVEALKKGGDFLVI
ncbi:aminotransferase class V-fold PLP-dependent enzyme [Mycoplasmopsis phocirhinis]|uniref:Aminotransferase class V-fold PLP-dependent enzyme n=1 Tax=Mycoplasmopsis phocirhinis TaxID=142650 RepID=A0A4P6MLT7_9BACT|nr:aminotransferase class V-fold PLP-dependent enzyme [Mycoplasmopsis phocirhinis]QBF34585.1 aminotransferase class V-fold PLP-dependent enzyme [Mycoplasmopsis phocirhinis]